MLIRRSSLVCALAALVTLVALFSTSGARAVAFHASQSAAAAPLIRIAQAEEAKPPPGTENELNQFIARNPGALLGGIALPFILLLTILARRRHYLWFSILIGAAAGAACQTIPDLATSIASPLLARLVQAAAAALVALVCGLLFDLMFFIGRLSRRLIRGGSLRGPDPTREWFRDAIMVRGWMPSRERTQDVDDAVARWHIALVTGAGALVASVVIQGHFMAGLHEHFTAAGFLTTSVILIAALYILEPVRERILHLADPRHREEGTRDSLVRTVIDSPRRGWLLSASIVCGVLLVQVLIIGLEEAVQRAEPVELAELALSGLGPIPIAYFLCAALQERADLTRAVRGTSAFTGLLVLAFLLMLGPILGANAGAMAANYVNAHLSASFASFTIVLLAGIAAALIVCAAVFWLSLGIALALGFIFNGVTPWVMQITWPRTHGARPLVYLAFAIVITTVLGSLVTAPLSIWGAAPGENVVRPVLADALSTMVGWIVGLWLSGVEGVLETYQQARPELFPKLPASAQEAPPPTEL
jgi:hypothetical protein